MIYTDKGEFRNFSLLRKAYLEAHDGNPPIQQYFRNDGWDDETLHISELGKCARKQMFRLIHAPKKPKSDQAAANDELMFWQGNIIHALTVGACDWSGIAVSWEENLPHLPAGWTGHYDLIFEDRESDCHACWDGKTVRSNAFDYWYSWPKPEEMAQMKGYLRFLEVNYGVVEHIDRGGANTPQFSVIAAEHEWVDQRMEELDTYRDELRLDIMPPVLPWEYAATYRKVNNEPVHKLNAVWYQHSWQCEWCDYLHGIQDKKSKEWFVNDDSPCKPDMNVKIQVAKTERDTLKYTNSDHEAQVHSWLEDQLQVWNEQDIVVE